MHHFQLYLRSLITVFLLCLLVAGNVPSLRADDGDDDDDDDGYGLFVPNQIVVKLDQTTGVTIDAINAAYHTSTLDTFLSSAAIYLLQTPVGSDVETILEQMNSDSRLFYAEPNFVGEAPEDGGRGTKAWGGQNPAPYAEQYALDLLGIAAAHEINQGDGTIIAVLDTGIQVSHPLFAESLTSAQYDFIDDDNVPEDQANALDDDSNGEVDEGTGHGTHVAGIAKLAAPNAQIMPLRVLDSDGRGNVFLIAEAIFYAAQQGAHVINLSLGTSDQSELLDEIITYAVETHDIFIVAAAGNLNSQVEQYPAALDSVMAVTAHDSNSLKSSIANYGSWVDLAAPGESIYSAFPTNGYAWWTGTSMAAPFVAGQAAILRSYCPSLTADKIFDQLQSTAQSLDALNPEYSGLLGKGRSDFAASLQFPCDENNDDDDDGDGDDGDDGDDDNSIGDNSVGNGDTNESGDVSQPVLRPRQIHLPFVIQR